MQIASGEELCTSFLRVVKIKGFLVMDIPHLWRRIHNDNGVSISPFINLDATTTDAMRLLSVSDTIFNFLNLAV